MCEILSVEEIDRVFNNVDYFNRIRKLQILSGLWPYSSSWWKYFGQVLTYSITVILLIAIINGVRIWCGALDLNNCCENLFGLIFTTGLVLKYFLASLLQANLKKIYERIANNWLTITDPDENAIKLHHAKFGKIFSDLLIATTTSFGLLTNLIIGAPPILDFIFPLNESRPKIMLLHVEFGVDPYEYYQIFCIYLAVLTLAICICGLGMETMYVTIIYQTLGIMAIVKHRLHVATEFADGEKDNSYDIIISAITLHQESIYFVKLIEASNTVSFLFAVWGAGCFLSLGAILILNNESFLHTVKLIPVIIGVNIYIFYLSFTAQKITDYSNDLFVGIYTTKWYKISSKSKKLLNFIMLRASRPCTLGAGGLYIMCMENFGKIMKSTASYIAVLSSLK